MCTDPPLRRQRGLTLIELLMFIVIVGIALAGILAAFRFTTQASADPLRRKQALMIAEGLLEEVELAKFTFCDPSSAGADSATSAASCAIPEAFGQAGAEPVGPRPYDNVNDYVAAANVPTAAFNVNGALADANGNPMNVSGYSARVTITPDTLGPAGAAVGTAGGTSADTDVLRIRVEVSYDGQVLALDGYRARYAPQVQ